MHIRLVILLLLLIPVGASATESITDPVHNLIYLLAEKNPDLLLELFQSGSVLEYNESEIRTRQDLVYRTLAAGLAAHGEYAEGVDILLLIPEDSRSYESVLLLAFLYTRMEKYQSAIAHITDLRIRYPDDRSLDNAMAYVLCISGSSGNAKRIMERVIKQADNNGAVLDTWGTILAAEGKPKEAFKALENARKLLPGDAEVLAHLGEVHRQLGRSADAQDLYQQSVRADPAYVQGQKGYARVLIDLGRYPEAAKVIKAAIRLMPGDPDLISWEQEVDMTLLDWHHRQEQEANRPLIIKRMAQGNHS